MINFIKPQDNPDSPLMMNKFNVLISAVNILLEKHPLAKLEFDLWHKRFIEMGDDPK